MELTMRARNQPADTRWVLTLSALTDLVTDANGEASPGEMRQTAATLTAAACTILEAADDLEGSSTYRVSVRQGNGDEVALLVTDSPAGLGITGVTADTDIRTTLLPAPLDACPPLEPANDERVTDHLTDTGAIARQLWEIEAGGFEEPDRERYELLLNDWYDVTGQKWQHSPVRLTKTEPTESGAIARQLREIEAGGMEERYRDWYELLLNDWHDVTGQEWRR